jgi:hypothetical protein
MNDFNFTELLPDTQGRWVLPTFGGGMAIILTIDAPDQAYPLIGYVVAPDHPTEVKPRRWTAQGAVDGSYLDDLIPPNRLLYQVRLSVYRSAHGRLVVRGADETPSPDMKLVASFVHTGLMGEGLATSPSPPENPK